jgi:hypothetical protein
MERRKLETAAPGGLAGLAVTDVFDSAMALSRKGSKTVACLIDGLRAVNCGAA